MTIDSESYGGICECGSSHYMATKLCVIEEGALKRFETYMAQVDVNGRRCVIYDTHTYHIPELIHLVSDQEIVLDAAGLHANEEGVASILDQLDSDIEVLVAVGAGTVHDLVRYCAKERNLIFVSVPTAASCDGFCSNVAAMTWGGYKITWAAKAPVLVVADLDVIAAAPRYLTVSGIGDILGKFIALADWHISHIVTGEYLCPVIYGITHDALHQVWTSCQDICEGSPGAYERVTYALLMSGLAMQMLGNSRPASGAEHHISHFIEVEPEMLSAPSTALHGEKVGVGTILASAEYHRIAEIADIDSRIIPYHPYPDERLLEVFGPRLYETCREVNEHDSLAAVTPEALIEKWQAIREIIAEIPSPDILYRILGVLGAKRSLTDIDVPEDRLSLILEASPLIRNRLTFMRMRRMISV